MNAANYLTNMHKTTVFFFFTMEEILLRIHQNFYYLKISMSYVFIDCQNVLYKFSKKVGGERWIPVFFLRRPVAGILRRQDTDQSKCHLLCN